MSNKKNAKAVMSFERTLAMIKPEVLHRQVEVLEEVKKAGFVVLKSRVVHVTPEQVSELYADVIHPDSMHLAIQSLCVGPLCTLVLGGEDAVKRWLRTMGPSDPSRAKSLNPNSLRAKFGIDAQRNALEGSFDVQRANHEIRFFFPDVILEPLPSRVDAVAFLMEKVHPTLTKGLAALCHAKPANQIKWLADWLMNNNPNKPSIHQAPSLDDSSIPGNPLDF